MQYNSKNPYELASRHDADAWVCVRAAIDVLRGKGVVVIPADRDGVAP